MTMTQRKVEILSPAGSFDSLMAAIHAGASAIYFETIAVAKTSPVNIIKLS
ncbi:MAG: hypothetical protein RLY89_833 [Bacteroidota bacterium]